MENKFEIIMYWSKDDNAVIAEVPELPGCMADGKDYSDALNAIQVVIDQWIQTAKAIGREIPMAKGKLMYA